MGRGKIGASVAGVAAAAVLVCGIATTSAAQTLTKASTASMLLNYEKINCVLGAAYYGPYAPVDDPRTAKVAEVESFFQGLTNSGYLKVQGQNVTYTDRSGTVFQVGWRPMGSRSQEFGFSPPVRAIKVSACLSVPTNVEILDTTIDQTGKMATVIFRNDGPVTTDFVRKLYESVGPPDQTVGDQPMVPEGVRIMGRELTATLRKLDATGWRVESVR